MYSVDCGLADLHRKYFMLQNAFDDTLHVQQLSNKMGMLLPSVRVLCRCNNIRIIGIEDAVHYQLGLWLRLWLCSSAIGKCMALLDNGGRVGQHSWSSAMYVLCGVEYWTQPTVGGIEKEKGQSKCTVEAKRARREQQKVQKKNAHCGESSQARYKLCSLFMLDSTIVVLELWLISNICSTWPTKHAQCALTHWHGAARGIMHSKFSWDL